MDEFVEVVIVKPLHGTYCSIDYRKLKEAVHTGRQLRITLVDIGTAIVDPLWWYKTAKQVETRVVNYKNNPMKFVYNYVPIQDNFKKNKNLVPDQLSLL